MLLLQQRVLPLQRLQSLQLAAGGTFDRLSAPHASSQAPSRASFRHRDSITG